MGTLNSEETNPEYNQTLSNRSSAVRCILPSGKKLNLSIIIKKRNLKKPQKQVSYKGIQEKEVEVPINETATNSPPVVDLLSKFLLVAEELNKLE